MHGTAGPAASVAQAVFGAASSPPVDFRTWRLPGGGPSHPPPTFVARSGWCVSVGQPSAIGDLSLSGMLLCIRSAAATSDCVTSASSGCDVVDPPSFLDVAVAEVLVIRIYFVSPQSLILARSLDHFSRRCTCSACVLPSKCPYCCPYYC